MAKLLKTRGIVLSHRPLYESDEMACIFTENGTMLELRAHGIRHSRRRSQLLFEPGCLVSLEYYGHTSGLSSLKEGGLESRHELLKQDYLSLLTLSLFLELTALAASYDKAPKLFILLEGALQQLELWARDDKDSNDKARDDKDRERLFLLLSFFQVRLLKLLGLLGSPEFCSSCDSPLGSRALWHFPETHFSCQFCAPQSAGRDAYIARTIALAVSQKFGYFCRHIPSEVAKEIGAVAKQLGQSIESFQGSPLRTAIPFYRYMGSKQKDAEYMPDQESRCGRSAILPE